MIEGMIFIAVFLLPVLLYMVLAMKGEIAGLHEKIRWLKLEIERLKSIKNE